MSALNIEVLMRNLQMGFPKSLIIQQAAAAGIGAEQLEASIIERCSSKHESKGREDYPITHIFGSATNTEYNDNLSFEKLIERSNSLPYEFPIYNNRLQVLCGSNIQRQEAAVMHVRESRPVIHSSVWSLCEKFLDVKRNTGSNVEQKLYGDMTREGLVDRLLLKRPLAFLTSVDQYVLKSGQSGAGDGFDSIGTGDEKSPLLIEDLLSYHEMQLSSLIAVSVPTHFINSGSRSNCGKIGNPGTYEPCGVYVAQVGSRFERKGKMEAELCWITEKQNTVDNGYGSDVVPSIENLSLDASPSIKEASEKGSTKSPSCANRARLQMWAHFYELDHLPVYEEAVEGVGKVFLPASLPSVPLSQLDQPIERYIPTSQGYLDSLIYQKRMKVSVETFLAEANERGSKNVKGVYCHVVGLGLGVWQIHPIQKEILIRCYRDSLCENHYPHISDVCFGWFGEEFCDKVFHIKNGEPYPLSDGTTGDSVKIIFSSQDPAGKLMDENEGKLLVAQYAWDGNSYPGNEYWMGSLSASGDPAAACCSTIQELQNPDVNIEYISGENTHLVSFSQPTCDATGGSTEGAEERNASKRTCKVTKKPIEDMFSSKIE